MLLYPQSPTLAIEIHRVSNRRATASVFSILTGAPEVGPLFLEPGSPWENGYNESSNGKLRDELLNGEIFTTLLEAQVLIENWRKEYNQFRPHSSLGYRPPAPEAIQPVKMEILT